MAIKITTLNPPKDGSTSSSAGRTYTDLHLDFKMESTGTKTQLFSKNTKKDLALDTDYKAISNSLLNIFNTSPGEKILTPSFGADLRYYLFEPVNDYTAGIIGDVILKSIQLYEPRVTVDEIIVNQLPEQNEYNIDIYLKIPNLQNQQYKFTGRLSDSGVNTSGY